MIEVVEPVGVLFQECKAGEQRLRSLQFRRVLEIEERRNVVGAGFIEDDNAFLGAVGADDEKRLNERGGDGKYRDQEPNAGRPAVIGEKAEHRWSRLGSFYLGKNGNGGVS